MLWRVSFEDTTSTGAFGIQYGKSSSLLREKTAIYIVWRSRPSQEGPARVGYARLQIYSRDRHSVSVMKDGTVVGHVPRELSSAYFQNIEL